MTFNLEPCKCDKLGRNVKDYRIRDFYEKIAEELLEAHEEAVHSLYFHEVTELIQVMTVCASRINYLLNEREDYFDDEDESLDAIQKNVIRHNRERGYFEEVTE